MTKPGDLDHYTRVRCYQALLTHYPPDTATARPAAARHAHGRPARGGVARDHPQELRLHALHRRPRPRGPRQGHERARRSTAPTTRRSCSGKHEARAGRRDGAVQDDRLRGGPRHLRAGRRGAGRRDARSTSRGRSCAAGWREGRGDPRLVHVPRRGQRAAPDASAAHASRASPSSSPASPAPASRPSPTSLLVQVPGDGRPAGHAARRRHRAQAPLLRAGLLQGAPRHQHPRIGFVASEITKNGGIAICAPIAPYDAVRKEVREMIEPDGGFVARPPRHAARGVRGARPQGPLRQGAGRHPQGVHRHLRPLRGARRTPR